MPPPAACLYLVSLISSPYKLRNMHIHIYILKDSFLTRVHQTMHCFASSKECTQQLLNRWRAITGTLKPPPPLVLSIVNDIAVKKGQADVGTRNRAVYRTIQDSELKLQYFAARQIACRLLSSEGYLCDHCWLPTEEDCICNKVTRGSLWRGIKLWVYMHPKDFLRKNNTGKLLWHSLGSTAVRLCIFGLQDQEDSMWQALQQCGPEHVWCVYPERSESDYRVNEIPIRDSFVEEANKLSCEEDACALHYILMDGTWTNSKAMLSRVNVRARKAWGLDEIRRIVLLPTLPSAMHDLRPQPSVERTCTAAAASQLLWELGARRELAGTALEKSAQLVDGAIECLFHSLAGRRKRGGKAICRLH